MQLVDEARVEASGQVVGAIGRGLLALIGVEEGDAPADVDYITDKLANLRIFQDAEDKMNLSVRDAGGEVLLVSQFTLLGDARRGRRPSFTGAARPETAMPALQRLQAGLETLGLHVQTGEFGAHMRVHLVNDGPVTILLDSKRTF